MKKRILIAGLAIIGILNIAAISEETVKLELNLKKGMILEQKFIMNMKMDGNFGKEDISAIMKMGVESHNTVKEVLDDRYKTAIELDRIFINMEVPDDTSFKVNLDTDVESNPQIDPLLKQFLTLKLDIEMMKNGTVSEINGLSEFFHNYIESIPNVNEETKATMKQKFDESFNDALINKQLAGGQKFGYPEKPVGVGSAWEAVIEEDGMKLNYDFKVIRITSDKVVLAVDGTINYSKSVEGSMVSLSGTFEMQSNLDRNTGINMSSEGDMIFEMKLITPEGESMSFKYNADLSVLTELK